MRAAFVQQIGSVDEILVADLPTPEPAPHQILVRVGAAAFNPIDLYVRSGAVAMPIPQPYILGTDFAGTVAAVGSAVQSYRVGDRVWGSNQGLLGRQGVAAEFALVEECWAYPTPDTLTDAEAAAQALVGITAYLAVVDHGQLQAGESIYVPGGSGGVGSMAIQMAHALGARVATSAGGPERVAGCRDRGADLALDYRTDDIPARLREFAPEGLNVWVETQREPNLEVAVPLLALRGRLVLLAGRTARPTLPVGLLYTKDRSIRGFAMFNADAATQRQAADAINRWATTGQVRPQIGRVFPLDQAADAQRLMESTLTGGATKVVLQIS